MRSLIMLLLLIGCHVERLGDKEPDVKVIYKEKTCPSVTKCDTPKVEECMQYIEAMNPEVKPVNCGEYVEICINGVIYYESNCGLAVKLNQRNDIEHCHYQKSLHPEKAYNYED